MRLHYIVKGINFCSTFLRLYLNDFFNLNIQNYPYSANVYDSMGDYYMEINDHKKALDLFKKALVFEKIPSTVSKVKKLEANK